MGPHRGSSEVVSEDVPCTCPGCAARRAASSEKHASIIGPAREFWRSVDAEWSLEDRQELTSQGYAQLLEDSGEILAHGAYIAWLRSSPDTGR
jgi:hypothetical protein